MYKGIRHWLTILMVLGIATAFGASETKQVRVGIFQVEPLNFIDEEGVAQGLNADLLREIASEGDLWQPEFVPVTWAEGLDQLQSETIDLMVSVSYSLARAQTMDFSSEPIMEVWGQVYVRPDADIVSTLDLEWLAVGVMRQDINGRNFRNLVLALGVECEVVEFDTHADLFKAVSDGKIAAGVAPNHFGFKNARAYGLVGTSIQFSPAPIYFASKKGRHTEVLKDIDSVLRRWKQDEGSFFYHRMEYWFNSDIHWANNVPLWLKITVAISALLTLIFLILMEFFKREVKLRTGELRASEERYRLIVENQTDLIVKVYPDGKFAYVSPTYCDVFGKTETELLGNAFLPLVHEDDQRSTAEEFNKIFEPPHEAYMEQRALTCVGWRWFAWRNSAILDEAGEVKEIVGIGRDITERKEADEASRKTTERLRLATKAGQVGIWEYDFKHDHLIWDDQMFELYDMDQSAFNGTFESWRGALHPEDLKSADDEFNTAIAARKSFEAEFRIIGQQKQVKYVRALAEIERDSEGNPIRAIGMNWDVSKQRQMVAALIASEQDYRQLFENMTTGFLLLKVQNNTAGSPEAFQIIQMNDAGCSIVKMNRDQLVGKSLTELFNPLEDHWFDVLSKVAVTGNASAYENRMEALGLVLAAWIFIPKPGYLAVVVSDTTARRTAEDAVLRAQQQLEHIVDNTKDCIWQIDLKGNYVYANSAVERMTGYSVDQILKMTVLDLITPEYHDLARARLAKRIAGTPDDSDYSFTIRCADGSLKWLELATNSVMNPEGVIEGIHGVARDVTQRKQAEQELAGSRLFLRSIIDTIPSRVFWKDRDSKYLGCNLAFAKDTGFENPGDVIGRTDYDFGWSSTEADLYCNDDRNIMETGLERVNYEEMQTRSDGSVFWLSTSKVPIRDTSGDVIGVLGAYQDITERKMMEDAVLHAQQQLEHIVDNTKDFIWQIDLKGNFVYANSAVEGMTGYSVDQILKMTVLDLMTPDYHEMGRERIAKRVAGNPDDSDYSFTIRCADGSLKWLELATNSVMNPEGIIVGVQGAARDVTQRKQAEQELAGSRLFLRSIIDTIPSRVFWKDLDSRFLGCNLAFAQDTGFEKPGDVIGRTDYDFGWSSTEADLYCNDDRNVMETGLGRVNYEEPQTRSDGSVFWLSTSKVPMRDASGNVIGVLGAYQDVTERKMMEEERVRLSAAINQSAEAIVIMDLNRLIQYVNPAFETVTGFSRSEAIGANVSLIKSGRHDDQFYANIWRTIEADQSWNGRIINRHKDGTYYTAESAFSPVKDLQGRVVDYVVAIRDVSPQVELEQHVRQAQKMDAVGRLAGGVAHDFNNILQSILGFSSILLNEMEQDSSQYDDVSEIRKAARRAGDLTRQLLTLSRKHNVDYAVQNLNEIIRGNEKMMRRLIGERIEFIFDLDDELKPVRADLSQIEQILLNLFINSRDAMPQGGRLLVKTSNIVEKEKDGVFDNGLGQICLEVSDSGCGIRADVREHLFEPFFTTKQVGEGTGLGLSVVYGIVQQHGGRIEVSSKVGEGAIFNVYLPVCDISELSLPDDKLSQDSSRSLEGHGESILVVEDDTVLRDLTKRMLSDAGYTVIAVSNVKEAIGALKSAAFDLLLVDMVLPDGSGLDLVRTAHSAGGNFAVLLCSGYPHELDAHESMSINGFRYMEKPIGSMQLLQSVREMLDEKRAV